MAATTRELIESMVKGWARHYWPDVGSTWTQYRDYYFREFYRELNRKRR